MLSCKVCSNRSSAQRLYLCLYLYLCLLPFLCLCVLYLYLCPYLYLCLCLYFCLCLYHLSALNEICSLLNSNKERTKENSTIWNQEDLSFVFPDLRGGNLCNDK